MKRVVLFSTIAVYGPSDGCVLNEMRALKNVQFVIANEVKQSHKTLILKEIATAHMRLAMTGSEFFKALEMSPTHPDTFYAETKCAAEQIVLNARGADGQPLGTVLRLGAVYGARIKGNYERLTRALAVGKLGTRLRP